MISSSIHVILNSIQDLVGLLEILSQAQDDEAAQDDGAAQGGEVVQGGRMADLVVVKQV